MGGKTKAVIFNLLLISAAQQLLRVSVGMVAAQAEELELREPQDEQLLIHGSCYR